MAKDLVQSVMFARGKDQNSDINWLQKITMQFHQIAEVTFLAQCDHVESEPQQIKEQTWCNVVSSMYWLLHHQVL